MSLVLDSSATLARAFPEERTAAILDLFLLIADRGAVVPELWRIEVANTLNVGIRRGQISKAIARAFSPTWKACPSPSTGRRGSTPGAGLWNWPIFTG